MADLVDLPLDDGRGLVKALLEGGAVIDLGSGYVILEGEPGDKEAFIQGIKAQVNSCDLYAVGCDFDSRSMGNHWGKPESVKT